MSLSFCALNLNGMDGLLMGESRCWEESSAMALDKGYRYTYYEYAAVVFACSVGASDEGPAWRFLSFYYPQCLASCSVYERCEFGSHSFAWADEKVWRKLQGSQS